ncbi:MAG: hypothetical protein WAM44_19340, partial [Chthoniobacterales bacterium]
PEEKPNDDVEKVLSDLKSVEERKQAVIDDLLRKREAAIKSFDEKLAKLGYRANSAKPKRTHHKKPATAAGKTEAKAKPATPGGDGGQAKVTLPQCLADEAETRKGSKRGVVRG